MAAVRVDAGYGARDAHLNINSVLSGYISNAGTTCTHGRKSLGFTYLPIYRRNVNQSRCHGKRTSKDTPRLTSARKPSPEN